MSNRPNILFLMPDQLRPDFLSCYGAPFIDTPHIDSLATDGTLYNRAYSLSPVCVAARHNLLTGLDSIRNGVLSNGQFLRPDHRACGIDTWPEMLGGAGYYTAAIGKMHFYPWDLRLGFQHRVIAEDKRWLHIEDDYTRFLQARGLRKLHGNEHEGYHENKGAIVSRIPWEYGWDRFVGQEAARFIRQYEGDAPFAAMVGFPGPHCPYDPSPEFLAPFKPEDMPASIPAVAGDTPRLRQQNINGNKGAWNGVDYTDFNEDHKRKIRAHYCGLVAQIDHEVGDILQALRDTGRLDNTVIVFASDHGDYLGDHDFIGKGTFFEGSTHVPLIVRDPRRTAAPACNDPVALYDITPSMLQWADCPVPEYMDAQSLPGLGLAQDAPREILIGMMAGGWMAYDGRWKLHKYNSGEHLLFNMEEDPHEQHNRLDDPTCQDIRLQLDAALTSQIMRSVAASRHDQLVYGSDLSSDQDFGLPSWRRTYPNPLL
ncbi:MAG: sulfatase-like hydrolase/transferase [Candidatus Latescibacteria bacterium]|nr:sulfatase-like hydrolase/transferase [Candidatus Latescibacterota bacterium]